MNEPRFSWDDKKAKENLKKHGISFEEGATVFRDDEGLRMYDPDHSEDEDRFLLLGLSTKGRPLVVSHCYRNNHEKTIRLLEGGKESLCAHVQAPDYHSHRGQDRSVFQGSSQAGRDPLPELDQHVSARLR
jgi:uncharacterized DUF497 family protein